MLGHVSPTPHNHPELTMLTAAILLLLTYMVHIWRTGRLTGLFKRVDRAGGDDAER